MTKRKTESSFDPGHVARARPRWGKHLGQAISPSSNSLIGSIRKDGVILTTYARAVKTTQNDKEVRYIVADMDCVKVESISGSVVDSGKYGINGTFFSGTTLLGVAVNNNGTGAAAVRTGGTQTADNAGGPTKRGVLYRFVPANGVYSVKTEVVKNFLDAPGATTSNVKWAIGGYSLHLGNSYSTSSAYYNDIQGSWEYAEAFAPQSENGRSAIAYAYLDGAAKIVMATFKSATVWEVRTFMKNLGCTWGVNLDGSGSSQLRYQRKPYPGASIYISESWEPKPDPNRSVYNMVTVNPTYWTESTGFY